MNAITKRISKLESATDRGAYEFAAVFLRRDDTFHTTLWQSFKGGLKAATKATFSATEPEAVSWLAGELAGQKRALPIFYLDQKTAAFVKMATYTGGMFTPAKLDLLALEKAAEPWGVEDFITTE